MTRPASEGVRPEPTAPAHVAEVRRLVFDPMTKAQPKQLREIGTRVLRAVEPEGPRPGVHPF